MLDFSLNVVADVNIIARLVDVQAVLFCCACCGVAVLDSVIMPVQVCFCQHTLFQIISISDVPYL
jgi:hypothetical protein